MRESDPAGQPSPVNSIAGLSRQQSHPSLPLIVETLARLRSRSCIIDGEVVACDDNGVAGQSREFLSLPNCAVEVLIHARRHGLVVLISNVFAYHLRVQEAVTANAAMPLVAGEDVRTPPGTFRIVFGVGHFNKSCI